MQGRLPSVTPSRPLLPSLVASLTAGMLLVTACRKPAGTQHAPGNVTLETLLSTQAMASGLIARGGADVSATTHFHIMPAAAEGLLGEQDVTTTTTLSVGADGGYSLHEENNHDGGRDVFFAGDQIAVKLRYGKLIKRTARAPEPRHLLEQALGGPAAAWEVFHTHAQTDVGPDSDTVVLSLGSATTDGQPPLPSSPLIDWRKTAVPTDLKGRLRFLPATSTGPAVLVAAEITGRFKARTTTAGKVHEVQGLVDITFAARNVGKAVAEPIPEEAETAWMRQRTILEERALLESGAPAKAGLPP